MSAKFCWIICSLSADNPAASAGCARIISSLDPRSSSSTDWPRKMRKYGRAVAEIELEAVVGGMLNRTLMPVLSVSSKRPPDKLPPGIKETADPAVTAISAASPLLAISLRRPSSSERLPRLAARPRWWPRDNCSAPRPTSRRDARLRASSGFLGLPVRPPSVDRYEKSVSELLTEWFCDMALPGCVLGQHYFADPNHALLTIARGEFIFCVKPDHILPAWRRMR